MGISRLTAWTITGNPVAIVTGEKDGKWGAVICHDESHPAHPYLPIFTIHPQFETREAAQESADKLVADLRVAVEADFAAAAPQSQPRNEGSGE
jgi:hypothetical protein